MIYIYNDPNELQAINKILKKEFPKLQNIEKIFEEKAIEVSRKINFKTVKRIFNELVDVSTLSNYVHFNSYFYKNDSSKPMFDFFEQIIDYISKNNIRKSIPLPSYTPSGICRLPCMNNKVNTPTDFLKYRKGYIFDYLMKIISYSNLYYQKEMFECGFTFWKLIIARDILKRQIVISTMSDAIDFITSNEYSLWKNNSKDNFDIDIVLSCFCNDDVNEEDITTKEDFKILTKKNKTEEEKLYLKLKYNLDF